MKTALLWIIAIVLVGVNVFLAMARGPGQLTGSPLIGFILGQTIVFPIIVVAIAAIWKKNRTMARALKFFSWTSLIVMGTLIMQVADIVSKPPKQVAGRFGATQLSVPASWETNPNVSGTEAISVMNGAGSETFLVFPESKSEGTGGLQQVAQRATDRVSSNVDLKGKRGPTPCAVDSLPCTQYEIDFVMNGTSATMMYSVVEGRTSFYHLLATTTTESYPRKKGKFSKILGSFREVS